MRFLIALALAAPLLAQNCEYVVTPAEFTVPAADQSPRSVLVTQTPGSSCDLYIANTTVPWIHIDPLFSGGLPGTSVNFTVDANLNAAPRSGVMTIALKTVTVKQEGAKCEFSVSPTSQNVPVGGGDSTFTVRSGCAWLASTNASWITLKSNSTSDVPIAYTASANTCVSGRSGTITIQTGLTTPPPPTVSVTQDGSPNNISLEKYSETFPAAATNRRIGVTTGDVCNWTAIADVNWVQITIGSSGTGNGGFSFRLLENTTAERTGHIRVGALTYTITQQAPGAAAPVLTSVTSAANYNADAVSPGEIVALFGTKIGPASLVTLQVENGTVTNALAGTQVLFDGIAAPLIYTSKGQVSAVVPYSVAGKARTSVQVKYLDGASNSTSLEVRPTHPAIFTLDSSGVGPGAILNQDLTVNTSGNRAEALSIIAIYCTGGGVTDPVSGDGEVIGGALRRLIQTATVTIGGVNAPVEFAGAVPGAVAGLTQINAKVPAGLAPTTGAPVIVKIGEWTSTPNVTVSIK